MTGGLLLKESHNSKRHTGMSKHWRLRENSTTGGRMVVRLLCCAMI